MAKFRVKKVFMEGQADYYVVQRRYLGFIWWDLETTYSLNSATSVCSFLYEDSVRKKPYVKSTRIVFEVPKDV